MTRDPAAVAAAGGPEARPAGTRASESDHHVYESPAGRRRWPRRHVTVTVTEALPGLRVRVPHPRSGACPGETMIIWNLRVTAI